VFPSGVHSVKLRHDSLIKPGSRLYRRAPQPQATGIRIAHNWRTLRHADCIKQCPSSSAKRKTYTRTDLPVLSPFTFFWKGGDQCNGRSIANLDAAVYPAVAVPVAFANEPARGLFDVYRRRRIVDRRRRSSA